MAVKVLRLDVPPERLHQLVAELERLIAADLTHSVIAAPIATGTDGLLTYLAHDYVPADSLDVVLRDEGPPAPVHALRVAAQLAGALDFAATANVYHGVLHPRDVLIAQNDTRLTGLGVAGAIEKVGVSAPRRRPYTAPERMVGGAWDRHADVFSLAALIHEMLWGRRLTAIGEEAANALTDLPGADLTLLKVAFARALAMDPADRFTAASDFVTALQEAFPDAGRLESTVDSRRSASAPSSFSRRSGRASPELTSPESASVGGLEALRLPLDPDLRDGLENSAGSAGLESYAASDDGLSTGVGDGHQAGPEPDDLELRAAEDARYEEVEVAPSIAWEPAGDAVDQVTVPAAPGIAPREDVSPTVPRSSLFHSYQIDSRERLDVQDEPREPQRSVTRPVAAALLVGLALGLAGGYALGGRRGTPVVASVPVTVATNPSSEAAAQPGREFTEAAVGESNPVRPQPDATKETGTPSPPAASATGPGRLLVRSTPAGARVFVDGREQGQTPATIQNLTRGTHRVRLVRDGYIAEERRVAITAAQSRPSLTVDLKRAGAPASRPAGSAVPATPATIGAALGSLTVDSRPAGARVFIDGKLVGTTPVAVPQLAAGEHAVRMERDGYRRWSSSVRVAGGQRQRVAASLER